MAQLRYRLIRPSDRASLAELYREHYWRPQCVLMDPVLYHWQLEQPPESKRKGGDQSIVAVDEHNRVVAALSMFPMSVWDRGSERSGVQLISCLNHPDVRGQGVGTRIVEMMCERYAFRMGRSLSPASQSVYAKFAFRYMQHAMRWLAILDAQRAEELVIEPHELTSKRLKAREIPRLSPRPYQVSNRPPTGAANLTWKVLRSATTFARTPDYLVWRYTLHPMLRYRFITLGEAYQPDGLAVVRCEKVSGRPGHVLRILEFIADEEHQVALARAVFDYGREQGCSYADLFGMSERFVAGFLAAGGFHWQEDHLRLPHLLQPWDAHDAPPGWLFSGPRDPITGIAATDNLANFYVGRGDGNMDWPSWATVQATLDAQAA